MAFTYFFGNTIETFTSEFLTLFNDLTIRRADVNGVLQPIEVPILFGTPEKAMQRILQRNTGDGSNQNQPTFPIIAVTLDSITMDLTRLAGMREHRTLEITYVDDEISSGNTDYTPIPYTLGFTVHLGGRYFKDMCQMLENILPNFAPALTLSVKERGFNINRKCRVVVSGPPNIHGTGSGSLTEGQVREFVWWTLPLDMQIVLYKPLIVSKPIKIIDISFYDGLQTPAVPLEKVTITGEEAANGLSTITVDIENIEDL